MSQVAGRNVARASSEAGRCTNIRVVTGIERGKSGISLLTLECGHVLKRRLAFCPPRQLVCPECKKLSCQGQDRTAG